jgi:hypothetical protein
VDRADRDVERLDRPHRHVDRRRTRPPATTRARCTGSRSPRTRRTRTCTRTATGSSGGTCWRSATHRCTRTTSTAVRNVNVARVPRGRFDVALEYWNGSVVGGRQERCRTCDPARGPDGEPRPR